MFKIFEKTTEVHEMKMLFGVIIGFFLIFAGRRIILEERGNIIDECKAMYLVGGIMIVLGFVFFLVVLMLLIK